jgi:hypothetical protein
MKQYNSTRHDGTQNNGIGPTDARQAAATQHSLGSRCR